TFDLIWALHVVAMSTVRTGDLNRARATACEGLTLLRGASDISGMAIFLDNFADLELAARHTRRAGRPLCAAAPAARLTGAWGSSWLGVLPGRSGGWGGGPPPGGGLWGRPRCGGRFGSERSSALAPAGVPPGAGAGGRGAAVRAASIGPGRPAVGSPRGAPGS